ncbi:MAG: hypothetical protein JSS72_05375 [Armatimonadetes bacterium]|nr:hypothetical protein [Armatimonadota bacterium]
MSSVSQGKRSWLNDGTLGFLLLWAALLFVALINAALFIRTARLADDAMMWQRYAANLFSTGRLAWNPGEPPAYGLSAPLFLVVGIPCRLLCAGNAATAALLSSVASGVVMLLALPMLAFAVCRRRLAVLFAAGAVAYGSTLLAPHFGSGMDTCFSTACLAGYFAAVARRIDWRWLAASGGMMFWVRPDLALFPVAACLGLALEEPSYGRRTLVGTFLALGLVLGANWMYFGSPVPLPFYAKSTGIYQQSTVYLRYHPLGITAPRLFLAAFWPLALVALPAPFLRRSVLDGAVLLGCFGFAAYFSFGALQIMGENARYYIPLVAPLSYLAARTMLSLPAFKFSLPAWGLAVGGIAAFGFVGLGIPDAIPPSFTYTRTDLQHFQESYRYYWEGLDRVAQVAPGLTLASTEVGMPSIMMPTWRIWDLSGLNDSEIAKRGYQPEMLAKNKPDIIYMHPEYEQLNSKLTHSPGFEDYEVIHLRSVMPCALRKTGSHYSELRKALFSG